MQKVKEEFFLSLIFVGKWLVLSLGGLGIVYFSIYLAYHKSYYDPIIEAYDIKISDLKEEKNNLEISLDKSNVIINQTNETIKIVKHDVNDIQKNIDLNSKKIEALHESIIDKYNPLNARSNEAIKLDKEKKQLLSSHKKKKNELKNSVDVKKSEHENLKYTKDSIKDIELSITLEIREKEKVGTGALGVLPWIAGILGLT